MADFKYSYDDRDLGYIAKHASTINSVASILNAPALGIAGGIIREMTLERFDYPKDPIRWLSGPLKQFLTSAEFPSDSEFPYLPSYKRLSHDTISQHFARSNSLTKGHLMRPTWLDELDNPALLDV